MRSVGSSGVLSITFLAVTWPAALHGDASWTGQEGAVQRHTARFSNAFFTMPRLKPL